MYPPQVGGEFLPQREIVRRHTPLIGRDSGDALNDADADPELARDTFLADLVAQ